MTNELQCGHFIISLPDETSAAFAIFENLADFFNTEVQSDAVELLKNELLKFEIKPKPNIDFESDFTHIDTKSADIIFTIAKIIFNLTVSDKRKELTDIDLEDIYTQLKKWKQPPKQKWKIGDVLSIPLLNKTFSFGQIVGTHLTKRSPILALFDIQKDEQIVSIEELKNVKAISVYNSDEEEICNHSFKVLINYEVLVSPERVKDKESSGGAALDSIANVYFGLEPWNVMYKDDYYDDYLLPDIKRPKNIIWLAKDERDDYRRKKFKIDENNNYIK